MNTLSFRIVLGLMSVVFLLSCATSKNEISLPEVEIASRIPFVGWHTTDSMETPMQGILLASVAEDHLVAERMGLTFVQGSTLGVCLWREDGPQCIPSAIPRAASLLDASRAVLTRLIRQRGFSVPEGKADTALLRSCVADARDEEGPTQLTCRLKSGARVTVRLGVAQEPYRPQ